MLLCSCGSRRRKALVVDRRFVGSSCWRGKPLRLARDSRVDEIFDEGTTARTDVEPVGECAAEQHGEQRKDGGRQDNRHRLMMAAVVAGDSAPLGVQYAVRGLRRLRPGHSRNRPTGRARPSTARRAARRVVAGPGGQVNCGTRALHAPRAARLIP
jgi:hypothetical protein